MTPEELEEAKHYATHYQDGYVKDLILNLLDHIEQQASRNTKLETALIDCRAEYLLFLDENPNAFAWDFDELSREAQDRYRKDARESLEIEEPLIAIQLREAEEQITILKEVAKWERASRLRDQSTQ